MELSGRILREVEFRDRLRGYDTDEVDEFLEKVAVAVDELIAELEAAREKLTRPTEPGLDEESLRRTLVLAQRTADLAVREAREEAAAVIEDARLEASALTSEARDEAIRVRNDAEQDAHARIASLEERRSELEAEIEKLSRFAASERVRLSAALAAALESLGGMTAVEAQPRAPAANPLVAAAFEVKEPEVEGVVADDDEDTGETPTMFPTLTEERPSHRGPVTVIEGDDAADEIEENPPPVTRRRGSRPPDEPTLRAVSPIAEDGDPDELLWQRWARGADLDANPEKPVRGKPAPSNRGQGSRSTRNHNGRRGGGWSA
jgi:cell division initiation protein